MAIRPETRLARVFSSLAEAGKSTDSVAAGILAIVSDAGVQDVKTFDPLVRAAYTANGWNPRPGRPTEDTKGLDPVPPTVRTYVTTVRRAFRFGVPVAKMKSFYDLRKALREARPSVSKPQALPLAVREQFAGVAIAPTDDPNGALVHDLGIIYANLPKAHLAVFENQLRQLVKKYLPLSRLKVAVG